MERDLGPCRGVGRSRNEDGGGTTPGPGRAEERHSRGKNWVGFSGRGPPGLVALRSANQAARELSLPLVPSRRF